MASQTGQLLPTPLDLRSGKVIGTICIHGSVVKPRPPQNRQHGGEAHEFYRYTDERATPLQFALVVMAT